MVPVHVLPDEEPLAQDPVQGAGLAEVEEQVVEHLHELGVLRIAKGHGKSERLVQDEVDDVFRLIGAEVGAELGRRGIGSEFVNDGLVTWVQVVWVAYHLAIVEVVQCRSRLALFHQHLIYGGLHDQYVQPQTLEVRKRRDGSRVASGSHQGREDTGEEREQHDCA